MVYPMPVFIIAAYDENGVACAMNAAWGGICGRAQIAMCLSAGHKTTGNILAKGAFTVSMADAAHVVECDYVGVVSGNNVPDKLEKAGLHTSKAEFVDAPLIDELAMALECKLISYDAETGLLLGEIVNIAVDESVLTADGNIDTAKLNPITYDTVNKTYLTLGEKVGDAFKSGLKLK